MTSPEPLSGYLARQCRRIERGEQQLSQHPGAEAVHDTRVGVRRLRSTIRVFSSLLEPDEGDLQSFDDDLSWLAGLLSDVRDVDVLDRRVRRQLDDLSPELVMGPVQQDLDVALAERRTAAVGRWQEARTQDRYAATVSCVATWQERPPVVDGLTTERLARRGRPLLKAATRKAERRLRRMDGDPDAVHRARKAVKRQRYAAELLEPASPKAAAVRKRATKMQQRLGRHQELVVESAFLREQAARFGGQEGHNGFSYGLLRGGAEAEAADIRRSMGKRAVS